MFASLPMYDLPEHREHTDALWAAVARGLRARGVEAPEALSRPSDLPGDWHRPDLLLSQTCGLPFVRHLRGRVALVGAADHGLPDCAPGTYRSRIVLRGEDPAQSLADLRGRVVATNSEESQSGAGALRTAVAELAPAGGFFSAVVVTGAHAGSIRAVAEGHADVAAIDAVTWEMMRRHLPEARALRVLLSTPETPSLPFVTRQDGPADAILSALAEAVEAVGPAARDALLLRGVLPRRDEDFGAIADADASAQPLGPDGAPAS